MLAAALRERRLERAFTIDVLGEAVTSEAEADQWQRHYLNLIEQLGPTVNAWPEIPQIDQDRGHPLPRVNVSIKLSALNSQFDPIDPDGNTQRVAQRLRPILRRRKQNAHVHVDMESYRIKDLTLSVFQNVLMEDEFCELADVGIVIQCYSPCRKRCSPAARFGRTARHAGLGAISERRILGLRNRPCAARRGGRFRCFSKNGSRTLISSESHGS